MQDNHTILTGLITIEAALSSGFREVHKVMIDEALDYRKVEPLRRVAKKLNIELTPTPRAELDTLAGDDKHGGAVAQVGPRRVFDLDALVKSTGKGKPFIVLLDGVEDPYNFAHAVRALWAAGCTGLIVRERNWYEAATLIGRASAGATELIPTAVVESPAEAAQHLKAKKLTVIAAAPSDPESVPMHDAPLTQSLLLMIGGEHRGVQKAALAEADQTIYIPYGRDFPLAVGTVAAAAALGFEVVRQRDEAS